MTTILSDLDTRRLVFQGFTFTEKDGVAIVTLKGWRVRAIAVCTNPDAEMAWSITSGLDEHLNDEVFTPHIKCITLYTAMQIMKAEVADGDAEVLAEDLDLKEVIESTNTVTPRFTTMVAEKGIGNDGFPQGGTPFKTVGYTVNDNTDSVVFEYEGKFLRYCATRDEESEDITLLERYGTYPTLASAVSSY